MPRFFIDKSAINGSTASITGQDATHISRVLRLKSGDELVLCDGRGNDYIALIANIDKEKVTVNITEQKKNQNEPLALVTLFQGIPKSDKMDFIIQKCVEIGIMSIVPIITEHVVVKVDQKEAVNKRVERWNKISFEAAKQSERGIVPKIAAPMEFHDALHMVGGKYSAVIPYEKETKVGLKSFIEGIKGEKEIAVFIGPEGGFAESEVREAVKHGAVPVTLGPRILRTETAGIFVLTILMYELGGC